jgi:hypothetical protein
MGSVIRTVQDVDGDDAQREEDQVAVGRKRPIQVFLLSCAHREGCVGP